MSVHRIMSRARSISEAGCVLVYKGVSRKCDRLGSFGYWTNRTDRKEQFTGQEDKCPGSVRKAVIGDDFWDDRCENIAGSRIQSTLRAAFITSSYKEKRIRKIREMYLHWGKNHHWLTPFVFCPTASLTTKANKQTNPPRYKTEICHPWHSSTACFISWHLHIPIKFMLLAILSSQHCAAESKILSTQDCNIFGIKTKRKH